MSGWDRSGTLVLISIENDCLANNRNQLTWSGEMCRLEVESVPLRRRRFLVGAAM